MIQTTTRLCVDVQTKYIHLQACIHLEINPRAHSIFFLVLKAEKHWSFIVNTSK